MIGNVRLIPTIMACESLLIVEDFGLEFNQESVPNLPRFPGSCVVLNAPWGRLARRLAAPCAPARAPAAARTSV